MRVDNNREKFTKVRVCGIEYDPSDIRIDRNSVSKKRYQYEVAGDEDSGYDSSRVRQGIMVNFFGTLISDVQLPVVYDNVLWLQEGD